MQKPGSIIIGRLPVIEALTSGRPIEKIFFQQQVSGSSIGEIRRLAKSMHVPIQQVPPQKLKTLTGANHQGVVAIASPLPYHELQDVIDQITGQGISPLLLMLEGVTDIRNIGAIARTALCFGAHALIIPDKGVASLNEEAIKSSAGALEKIMVCRVGSLLKAIDTLHLNGIQVYVSDLKATEGISELPWQLPCCVVLGSEDKGVQPHIRKAADKMFKIPMQGAFDSLNVSVAAGIILYEAIRGRTN